MTVRRVVKSTRYQDVWISPGVVGVVVSMDQRVSVAFPESPAYAGLWTLYDGDLILVDRPDTIAGECRT